MKMKFLDFEKNHLKDFNDDAMMIALRNEVKVFFLKFFFEVTSLN